MNVMRKKSLFGNNNGFSQTSCSHTLGFVKIHYVFINCVSYSTKHKRVFTIFEFFMSFRTQEGDVHECFGLIKNCGWLFIFVSRLRTYFIDDYGEIRVVTGKGTSYNVYV